MCERQELDMRGPYIAEHYVLTRLSEQAEIARKIHGDSEHQRVGLEQSLADADPSDFEDENPEYDPDQMDAEELAAYEAWEEEFDGQPDEAQEWEDFSPGC